MDFTAACKRCDSCRHLYFESLFGLDVFGHCITNCWGPEKSERIQTRYMHSVSGQRLIEPKSLNLVYSYCDEPWADVGYLPGKSGNSSPFGSLHQWPDEGKKAWECGAQGLDEPF